MKVKKIVELKSRFSFEAPILPARIKKMRTIPAADSKEVLDLNQLLAPIPANYYLVRVNGESMIDEGILDGDILVVDRSAVPADGKVVIAALNGELAVKTFRVIDGSVYLFSANKKFLPIEIKPFWEFEIQGVVRHVIRKL
ncbi:MAG: LexA family protein [Candidatus Kapaibacterium sp.]